MSNIVLMEQPTDCEVAALANACGVTYEQAKQALMWRELPKGTENPVFGNPWNLYRAQISLGFWKLYRALISLGFWKRNITLTDLLSGTAEPGRTVVLVHSPESPTLVQHWITWHGIQDGFHLVAWGNNQQFRRLSPELLTEYFRKGWPNCAFQVYKASALNLLWQRIVLMFS